jgi:hypothetical protein
MPVGYLSEIETGKKPGSIVAYQALARALGTEIDMLVSQLSGDAELPRTVYSLFAQAMHERRPVTCRYNGKVRELCPVILGHSRGREKALTFQFAGGSRSRLPGGGEWRCLFLDRVSDVELGNGPWRSGDSHTRPQACVEDVDLDVNPSSPYRPKRRL